MIGELEGLHSEVLHVSPSKSLQKRPALNINYVNDKNSCATQ